VRAGGFVVLGVAGAALMPVVLSAGAVPASPRVTVVETQGPVRIEEAQVREGGSLDLYLRNTSADTAISVAVQGMAVGTGQTGGFAQRIDVSLPPGVADIYTIKVDKTLRLAPAEVFVSAREVVLVDRTDGRSLWKAGHLEAIPDGHGYRVSSEGFLYTHRAISPGPDLPGLQSCCEQCEDTALGCGLAMVRGQCRPYPCVISMDCGGEDPHCYCSFTCKDPSQCC
jgi:hypothetical protein